MSVRLLARRAGWLSALLIGGAAAQSALTPEDAVRLALARPEAVAQWQADVALAEADLTDARTWPNPELALEREAGDRAQGEPDETSVMLSQTFELGGRRGLQRRAAALGRDAAQASIAFARAELRALVLQRYYDALAAEQRRRALEASLERLERLQAIAGARHAEGDLSGFERMRIAQQYGGALQRRDDAVAAAQAARAELAAELGVDADSFELPADFDRLVPADDESADASTDAAAALASAELAALAARRTQAEATLEAARRWQLPLSVGVGQKRFDAFAARDDVLLLEVALPLPLFDRNQGARQRAEAQWLRADAEYRRGRHALALRRASLSAQARRFSDGARRMRDELLPQSIELARIAEASFAEGELDLSGLVGALEAEADAIEQALDLALQARHARIELELLHPTPSNGDR